MCGWEGEEGRIDIRVFRAELVREPQVVGGCHPSSIAIAVQCSQPPSSRTSANLCRSRDAYLFCSIHKRYSQDRISVLHASAKRTELHPGPYVDVVIAFYQAGRTP